MRALQQPPNAAQAERAISKQALPSLYEVLANSTRAGAAPRAPGGAQWQKGGDQPTARGTVNVVPRREIHVKGGRRVGQEGVRKRGTQEHQQTGAPTDRGGATQTHRTREPHQEGRGRAQQTRRRGAARQERQPGQGTRMEGMGERAHGRQRHKGDGLASQPCRYRVPRQSLLNWHQVGVVSRSPDGLFAQQQREPTRSRPAVKGKGTYGGRSGQHVEEQGTWASHTRKYREASYGRPVDRGAWTAKTVKQPRQQPAQPQYANYRAPLTRKRHTMPHPAQPRHTNYWAPRTRKRHQC